MAKPFYTGPRAALATKLREVLTELSAYEQAYRSQRIVFFKPIQGKGQEKFFEAQQDVVRLVLGSNRSGKTVCGVNEAIAHSLGYRPWLPADHPLRIVRLPSGRPIPVPNVGRVLAENYEQAIRQTIMAKFDEWAPKMLIKRIDKNTRGIPVSIEWTNGSVIYLMSNDQDDMAFEGPAGHWFWCDEPPEYRKYTGLKRGLVDHGGHCWITMTPLSQPWINDTVVARAGDPGSGISAHKFYIWDNCIDNGGYLERAAIEAFLQDLREEELEARLHGNFLHLAGLVYKTWEPNPPYWVPEREIPRSWPRVQLVDPHSHKPLALLWVAVSPSDVLYVYRATYERNLRTVEDASDYIKQREGWKTSRDPGEDAEPVVLRIIDWSAKETERTSGVSIHYNFAEQGLYYQLAKKANAEYGYNAIHEALKMRTEWSTPQLVVFNTCAPVKQNFTHFCYDDWATSRQSELKGPKEGYRSRDDDFIDLLRYFYQHKLTYRMLKSMMSKQATDRGHAADLEAGNGMIFSRDGTRTGYGRSVRG
mgnify:CR=1 FL=1